MKEEDVFFRSRSGGKLYGRFFVPEKNVDSCIIFCNGYTGTVRDSIWFCRYAARRGYAVFDFDFFSHGRSTGRSSVLTISKEKDDLEAAVDVVLKRYKKIAFVCHSLGCLIACMLSKRSNAIVMWAPGISIGDIFRKNIEESVGERANIIIKDLENGANLDVFNSWWVALDSNGEHFKLGSRMWIESQKIDYVKISRKIKVPVRVVQSGKDGDVFIKHNKIAFENFKSKKKDFVTIKDANHVFKGHLKEVYDMTLDWMEKFL